MRYNGRIPPDRERVSLGKVRGAGARKNETEGGQGNCVPAGRTRRLKEIEVVKVSVHTLRHNPGIRYTAYRLGDLGTADAARPHRSRGS